MHDPQEDIGCARVIDVLSPVSAFAPVDRPIGIDAADVNPTLTGQPSGHLAARDPFASVFGDLAAFGERNRGKAALAINLRMTHKDARC